MVNNVPVFLFEVVEHPSNKRAIFEIRADFLPSYSVVSGDSGAEEKDTLLMKSLIIPLDDASRWTKEIKTYCKGGSGDSFHGD